MVKCDYCNNIAELIDSSHIYVHSYGLVYYCGPCKAWVGVHKGTKNPLGRLANKELRDAKIEAHKYFDNLWERKIRQGFKKGEARNIAYKWLSEQLKIDFDLCHIGMFDVNQCKQVVEICKKFYKP